MKAAAKTNPIFAALACALAGGAMFQFFGNATRGYIDTASVFWWWGFQWFDAASEAEHGLLIVALSGWLGWRNLRGAESGEPRAESSELRAESADDRLQAGSYLPALAAMAVGLTLHALGFAAQQTRVSILALLLFAWGVVRLGGGPRWGRVAAFPLGFLVFAIPLGAIDEIGLPLRLSVVEAGEWLARAAGIAVVRNGTQLLAPDGRFNYDVAAPCSGVNSLVALTALSVLIGYLNFRGGVRRLLVLLPCLPLVYGGNVARITAIVFAAQWGGPKWGEFAHTVMGYGVFVIVLGGVLAAATGIRRWWPEPWREATPSSARPVAVCHVLSDKRFGWQGWRVAAVVVTLAAGEMFFLQALATRPSRGRLGIVLSADGKTPVELPAFLGTEWIGRRAEVTPVERELLPPDTGFARKNYVAVGDPSKQVFLSVVLSGRDRSSIHRPELCLVGQGWTIAGAVEHRFEFPRRGAAAADVLEQGSALAGDFPATILRVRREVPTTRGRTVVPQLVAYWFVGGDAVVATHGRRLALDAWNRVARARVDRWAYVLMQTDATDGEAAALARMQGVLTETLPVFQRPMTGR